jgi:hypothetical protein
MAKGNMYMAHRYGFTEKSLVTTLCDLGFPSVASRRRQQPYYDLYAVATKTVQSEQQLRALAAEHFPMTDRPA